MDQFGPSLQCQPQCIGSAELGHLALMEKTFGTFGNMKSSFSDSMWNFWEGRGQEADYDGFAAWTLHWHVVVVSTFPVSNPLVFPWCCLEVKYSNLKHPSIKIGWLVVEIPWKHLLFSEVWSLQLLQELRQQRLTPQLQTFSCALRAIGTYRCMGWCWGHINVYISFYRKNMYLM